MSDLSALAWPLSGLGEATLALARRRGLSPRLEMEMPAPPALLEQGGRDAVGRWIQAVADWAGLEAEAVEAPYPEVETLVRGAGPALVRLPDGGGARFLALVRGGRRRVVLLDPALRLRHVRPEAVRAALCDALEAPIRPEVERLLDDAGVAPRLRARARTALLRQRLSTTRIGDGWLLRLRPGASFWRQVQLARLPGRLLGLVAAHVLHYALWLLSWWMVGRAALEGRLDRGWLVAWALLLVTLVPFQLLVTWLQGRLAIGAGALLKGRLLAGALRLEPDELRHQGAGQLLGRVIESQTLESLALTGGFLGLVSGIELLVCVALLAVGAGGLTQALALAVWIAVALLFSSRYWRRRRLWTETRLRMTHDLVEGMVGHRTRLAQEDAERWHEAEDGALERYLDVSRGMDRAAAGVHALVPRGWLVLGLLGLVPALVWGRPSPAALAVSIGGVVLAYRAFGSMAAGLVHLAGAAIAWQEVAPLFHAAARPEPSGSPALVLGIRPGVPRERDERALLEAHNLVFRYHDRIDPVVRGGSLRIGRHERLLLEGPSGGGKSTLASLLCGLRIPDAGLLLLDGLDRQSLGAEGWRRRVVFAPQFHENHVLTGTFAFNALLGRAAASGPQDAAEVEAVCRALGLGDLLDRMPAGLSQMVGETGWQLSHGERSRLYIARALLQGAELILLDESFAALDPENLGRALQYVLDRAPTLLVVAHP